MTTLSDSKPCRKCKEVKPFADFYVRSGFGTSDFPATEPSHYNSECISCMRQRSRDQVVLPITQSVVPSEALLIERLRSEGIPALPGKAFGAADVDVLAHNLVRVEAKFSRLEDRGGSLQFRFSITRRQQQRGFRASVVVLICELASTQHTFHVFYAADPVFYMNGRLKKAFSFTPDPKNQHSVITQPIMDAHRDAWWIIEQERQRICEALRSGSTLMQEWGIAPLAIEA